MAESQHNPDIPAYTYKELKRLDLPGYKEPASMYDIFAQETDWTRVLSVTALSIDPYQMTKRVLASKHTTDKSLVLPKRVLTVVRKPKPKDVPRISTHDHVASTPTMQIPNNPFRVNTLLGIQEPYRVDQEPEVLSRLAPFTNQFATVAKYRPNPQQMDDGGTLNSYVDMLNKYKLSLPGVTDMAGRTTTAHGVAALSSAHIGFSRVGVNRKGEPLFEALALLAAAEYMPPEAVALLPAENEKYAHIGWTENSDTFARDAKEKDTCRLVPTAGNYAIYFCAFGRCLDATAAVTARDDIDELLMLDRIFIEASKRQSDLYKRIIIASLLRLEDQYPSVLLSA